MSSGGKFKTNDKKSIAEFFQSDIQAIQRIWKNAMRQIADGLEVDVSNKRKGRCGRKAVDINLAMIPTIPLNKRSTIRSLSWQLGCSPTTLFRKFTAREIKRVSSAVRPVLTEKHMKTRVEFCVSMLDERTRASASPWFTNMHKIVHIDEKFFVMTKENRNYYLLPEEEGPTRQTKNKNSIGKVMLLTSVARPRFDDAGNETFSGKIGCWPFVKEVPAARKSDNKPKCTLETKALKVNREVMQEFFIDKVLPAIVAAWPDKEAGQTIFIQQDNAKPHILPNDPEFAAAVAKTGLDIRLIQQPACSPDLNVLDLGFFNSIQSLTDCRSPKTLQDLIKGVLEEFEGYDSSKLNRIFLTLQCCMVEIMNNGGGNGYSIPHVNKDKLERLGRLPLRLQCPPEVYAHALYVLGLDVQ